MQIDIGRVKYEGNWVEFGDAKLKIRPYPASRSNYFVKDGGQMVISGDEQHQVFEYCLEAWENVVDVGGRPLKLTSEVKKTIFDFGLGDGMAPFVLRTARELREAHESAIKN